MAYAPGLGPIAVLRRSGAGAWRQQPAEVGRHLCAGQTAGQGATGEASGTTGMGSPAPGDTGNGISAAATAGSGAGSSDSTASQTAPGSVEGLSTEEASTLGYVVDDYRVTIEGGVRQPDYLAAPGATLEEIVNAANGLTPEADLDAIEITSVAIDNVGGHSITTRKRYSLTPETLGSIALQRLDVVEIRTCRASQDPGNITEIEGEVIFPGTFHILKGEKLSSVLSRAGGLTRPIHWVPFFRNSQVARVQTSAYDREADNLRNELMACVAQGGGVLSSAGGRYRAVAGSGRFLEDVIRQLREKSADGRISIIADPVALAANPDADIELQPGDRLFVPKRPSEVMVTGEVLEPGQLQILAEARCVGLYRSFRRLRSVCRRQPCLRHQSRRHIACYFRSIV